LHHRHPGEPAGRIVLGGDHHRRLPDGKAGPRGPGAGRSRYRLLLRRLRRHADPGRLCGAPDRGRLQVWPRRVFLADGAGPHRSRRPRLGFPGQGHRHDPARPAARPDRHGRELGRGPLFLRRPGTHRRPRLHRDRHGRVRLRGDHLQPGQARGRAPGVHLEGDRPVPDQGRLQAHGACHPARHRPRLVRPTTPVRRPPSSRCSRWASRPTP
ncbi:MAG: hypothetical protein K0R58_3331, partial [Ramlibacter sp.]|nr:hypothetical protein [Ramlibacter sp.]